MQGTTGYSSITWICPTCGASARVRSRGTQPIALDCEAGHHFGDADGVLCLVAASNYA